MWLGSDGLLHVSVYYKSPVSQVFLEIEIIGPHSKSGKCDLLRHSLPHFPTLPISRTIISIPSDQFRTKNLAGKELATDADTKQAANSRLQTLDTHSFHAGMLALVPRWDKCLNVSDDYVEVWCVPCATHVLRGSINRSRNKVLGVEVFITWLFKLILGCVIVHAQTHQCCQMLQVNTKPVLL
jgi:hypothetical protein